MNLSAFYYYKISCDLEGHSDLLVNAYSFFIVWFIHSEFRQLLKPNHFKFSYVILKKELPVSEVLRHQYKII